jgi:DivIVA domain-containing protein
MASDEPASGETSETTRAVHHRSPPATGGRAAHAARDVDFPMALRGYDRGAVDRYVEEVNQAIAELEISSSPQSAIRHALEQVSDETSGLLQRAHETADEITQRSRAQADDRLQRAQSEADEVRETANREAADTRAKLAQELEQMRAEGQARVDALTRNAEAIADERRRLIGEVLEIAERLGELAREEAQRFLEREEAAREEAEAPTEKIETQPDAESDGA